jgi:formylglycine-generating enzyme required for sulfatase activity
MKTHSHILSLILAAMALIVAPAANAQLSAGNVRAAQRPATKLVDIDYDVTGVTTPVIVALEISADGGTTWTVPATSVTGAVGNSVTPGNNLRITWGAGADWNLQVSTQTKFRVNVTDAPLGMSLIPAGTFTMGNSVAADTDITDAPTRTVNVSAFYMAQNLVTKAEWDVVRTWALSNGYTDLAAGEGKAGNHPVQTVSWFDGVKWCNARSQQEGLTPVYTVSGAVMKIGTTAPVVNWSANGYRLPTEAEWEKAARGGLIGKRFSWGDTISQSQANYYASSSFGYDLSGAVNNYHPTYAIGAQPYTSPVGSFAANGYGLNDMAGNVWQWCWDLYGTYASGTPTDPRGASSGTDRVGRGGRWHRDAYSCRNAYREFNTPTYSSYGIGFRVARSLTDAPLGMSLIPAGTFTMGNSVATDTDITDAPAHTVNVSAFYMAQNMVTKAEWDTVRTWAASNGYTDLATGEGKASNHAVQAVSWWNMVKYCNARSQQEGLTPVYTVSGAVMKTGTMIPTVNWAANGYRLPTEAEWEKASRGGLSGKRFPWGDTISHSQANYYASSSYSYDLSGAVNNYHPTYNTGGGGAPYTSPVGSFAANRYGLYDMAGNVWQWCWDWYGAYDVGISSDPRGANSGSFRVNRGGYWSGGPDYCRAAFRDRNSPASTNSSVGLRLTRSSVFTVTAESPNVTVDTRAYLVVALASPSYGSITGAGNYPPGTTATLTAIPATGYVFTTWTGDASGAINPLMLTMNADKTIGATFSPDTNDTDDDGFTNYEEIVIHGTNPTLPDTDSDGVKDSMDAFPLNTSETLDTDDDGIGDNADTDDDGDGLSDNDEINTHLTNPKRADSDGDGLSDPIELQIHLTNPNLADTDNDGLRDGAEVNTYGTFPNVADTDGDGFLDGYEVLTGKSPLNILDKPALVAEVRTAIEFTFPSALGKNYRIEDSLNLTSWETVESGIAGNGAQIQRFYSTRNVIKRYFRVEEDAP